MEAFLRNNGRMEKWIMSYFVTRALRKYWQVLPTLWSRALWRNSM